MGFIMMQYFTVITRRRNGCAHPADVHISEQKMIGLQYVA